MSTKIKLRIKGILPPNTFSANVLRNVMATNDCKLLEEYTEKMEEYWSHDPKKVDKLIGKAYEDLLQQDIPVSKDVTLYVVKKLIGLRYYTKSKEFRHFFPSSAKIRADYICKCIDCLEECAVSDSEIFLFISKFIAQNLHVLKHNLRITYDILPWEEMEFCVTVFILSLINKNNQHMLYRLVINKSRIIMHLKNFGKTLFRVLQDLGDKGLNEFPKSVNRVSIVHKIVQESPQFECLYEDFELIKDVYSLTHIDSYIRLSLSTDLLEETELAKLVIERTLQVIGESLKNTIESPNLSESIHRALVSAAPKNVQEIITTLRNNLSHSYALERKLHVETTQNLKFFADIQTDLKKLHPEVVRLIYKKKMEILLVFANMVDKCESIDDFSSLVDDSGLEQLKNFKLGYNPIENLEKIKSRLDQIITEVEEPTEEEKRAISEFKEFINEREENFKKVQSKFDTLCQYINRSLNSEYTIDHIKIIFRNMLRPLKNETFFPLIIELHYQLINIRNVFGKRLPHNLDAEIFRNIEFGATRIGQIRELELELTKKIDVDRQISTILSRLENTIIDNNIKREFHAQLNIAKTTNDNKMLLMNHFAKSPKIDKNTYEDILSILNLKKKKFSASYKDKDCPNFVKRLHNPYGELKIKITSTNLFSFSDKSKVYLNFVKNLKISDNGKEIIYDAVKKIIDEDRKLGEVYFAQRLSALKTLIPDKIDSTFIAEYEKNVKLQAAVEMLTLDLLEILDSMELIKDNRTFLDAYSPVLLGKNLRNYLAHGNLIVSILPIDLNSMILTNVLILMEDGIHVFNEKDVVIGLVTDDDPSKLIEVYKLTVRNLNKMLAARLPVHSLVVGNSDIEQKNCENLKINSKDKYGYTPLIYAAKYGHIKMIEVLLNCKTNVNVHDNKCNTALHWAVCSGFFKICQLLLNNRNCNVNSINADGQTPLHIAVLFSCEVFIELLLCNSINPISFQNLVHLFTTILNFCACKMLNEEPESIKIDCCEAHKAAKYEERILKTLTLLLSCGADINMEDKNGRTALSLATSTFEKIIKQVLSGSEAISSIFPHFSKLSLPLNPDAAKSILTILLENALFDVSWSVQYAAANKGHLQILKLFTGNNIETTMSDNFKWTPLHLAINNNSKEIAEELLKYIDVDAVNNLSQTSLHIAAKNGYEDIVRMLLKHSANMKEIDVDNLTPLHYAVKYGHSNIVAMLLNPETIEAGDTKGRTPLHLAVYYKQEEIVSILLKKGADVNAVDRGFVSPLHIAVIEGLKNILQMLLSKIMSESANILKINSTELYNATINSKITGGWTPLHAAVQYKHKDIAVFLLKNNADINAKGMNNHTPLHLAAESGNLEMLNLLLEKGANINATGTNSWTPLFSAINAGHTDTVATLLSNNAHLKVVDGCRDSIWSALHLAVDRKQADITKIILKRGLDVNSRDNCGQTALHKAVKNGDINTVKLLLQFGTNVNAVDDSATTPFHTAIANGQMEIVELLLNNSSCIVDVNMKARNCCTPLHISAEHSQTDIATILLKYGANVNLTDKKDETSLYPAVKRGNMQLVQILLQNGALVDGSPSCPWTPLHAATINKENEEVIKLLLKAGANINAKQAKLLKTPLHFAVWTGNENIVRSLLSFGAKINAKSIFGWTPLHVTAYFGYTNLINTLVQNGACVNEMNNSNCTPLHLAALSSHIDVVNILLQNGADPSIQTIDGSTALHVAASMGSEVIMKLLISQGVNVMIKNHSGMTPLHVAVENDNSHVVKLLLKAGSDINVRSASGFTPLHLAAMKGCKNSTEVLLQNGADVNLTEDTGRTACFIAAEFGNRNIVNVLIKHNADVESLHNGGETLIFAAVSDGNLHLVETLIKANVEVNVHDDSGHTPLHKAVMLNFEDVVKILLKNNASINAKAGYGETPLHVAVVHNHTKVTEILLNSNADTNISDYFIRSPLYMAVMNGNTDIATMLLNARADVNFRDFNSNTLLIIASLQGHDKIVRILLNYSADVHLRGQYDYTALHAAAQSDHVHLIDILINAGIDINATAEDNFTPLHTAILNGSENFVGSILISGADIQCKTKCNYSALHIAVKYNRFCLIDVLIKAGSEIDAKDENGLTPLQMAIDMQNKGIEELLLQNGANNVCNISKD